MTAESTIQAIELFVGLVTVAGLVGLVVRRLAIPYTVALVILGLLAGALLSVDVEVSPELVLLVLLPGLVFEASLRIDIDEFRRAFLHVGLLAVPGVLVSAAIVAAVLYAAAGLPLDLGFIVGAMVAATDPVAVVSTFRQLGSPRRLATLIESESLLNDGTAIVLFVVAVRATLGPVAPIDAVVSMVATVVISTAIGLVAGYVASRLIASVDDHLIELTLSVAAAYGTYVIADRLGQSGIIATVVAGLMVGNHARRVGMGERSLEALDTVWEFFAFLLTALVFLLIGLAISVGDLVAALPWIAWASWRSSRAGPSSSTECWAGPHGCSAGTGTPTACRSPGSMSCSGVGCAARSRSRWPCHCRSTCPSGRCSSRSRSGSCCSRCSCRGRPPSG